MSEYANHVIKRANQQTLWTNVRECKWSDKSGVRRMSILSGSKESDGQMTSHWSINHSSTQFAESPCYKFNSERSRSGFYSISHSFDTERFPKWILLTFFFFLMHLNKSWLNKVEWTEMVGFRKIYPRHMHRGIQFLKFVLKENTFTVQLLAANCPNSTLSRATEVCVSTGFEGVTLWSVWHADDYFHIHVYSTQCS